MYRFSVDRFSAPGGAVQARVRAPFDLDLDFAQWYQDESDSEGSEESVGDAVAAGLPGMFEGELTLLSIESSATFQSIVTLVILASIVAVYCQAARVLLTDDGWDNVNTAFLLFFFGELTFRMAAHGRSFFCTSRCWETSRSTCEDIFWNYFDLSIVVSGLMYEAFRGSQLSLGELVFLCRALRLLRILRAVRILKQFPELYLLMRGLVQSLQSVVWVAVMFCMFLFVCGMFLTRIVGHNAEEFDRPDLIYNQFGTVRKSMGTLFIFLTCDDWSTTARIVNQRLPWMEFFWVPYIFVGSFTLLSLLTGLMADEVEKARSAQYNEMRKLQECDLALLRDKLQRRFARADEDNDHKINIDEFRELLENPAAQAEFHKWGIHNDLQPENAADIFVLLFKSDKVRVGWDELLDGLAHFMQLHNKAHTRHIMLLEGQVLKLDRALRKHAESERVDQLLARAALMRERVNKLDENVKAVLDVAGYKPAPSPWWTLETPDGSTGRGFR